MVVHSGRILVKHSFCKICLRGTKSAGRMARVANPGGVLIAIGINWEGRRKILALELAGWESLSSWKELLAGLRQR